VSSNLSNLVHEPRTASLGNSHLDQGLRLDYLASCYNVHPEQIPLYLGPDPSVLLIDHNMKSPLLDAFLQGQEVGCLLASFSVIMMPIDFKNAEVSASLSSTVIFMVTTLGQTVVTPPFGAFSWVCERCLFPTKPQIYSHPLHDTRINKR